MSGIVWEWAGGSRSSFDNLTIDGDMNVIAAHNITIRNCEIGGNLNVLHLSPASGPTGSLQIDNVKVKRTTSLLYSGELRAHEISSGRMLIALGIHELKRDQQKVVQLFTKVCLRDDGGLNHVEPSEELLSILWSHQ